ncbi:putative PEP-binding protein [Jannaschia seohaensis]|uniref:Pyruvate, phosphate dikinase n=1 Tax=Jannaschia seohaensis TaxID=475081 RepID=A0A2Y9AWD0_9RHOB|nr:putative PEP-binding protein [Jannaschia seohaensis]PWJ18312.1 pyruvate,orthophosphate dikinase [Jannaschia seohaensis]SSA46837.1 pyruvate, orthophosphate dikinase [Jannaschia seohaensis]
MLDTPRFTEITSTADIRASRHGSRAKCLQRLIRMDLPVPQTVALPFETVREVARGDMPDLHTLISLFDGQPLLLSVRSSSEMSDWGGPGAVLNIGMNDTAHAWLSNTLGHQAADALYLRFIKSFAIEVMRLDEEPFAEITTPAAARATYEDEMDEPFPQAIADQLGAVLRAMARAWDGTSARLLRQAQGAPAEAGLGLVVQRMAQGMGAGQSGAGVVQFVNPATGEPQVTGRYMGQAMGRDALLARDKALYLTEDPRGPSLQDLLPEVYQELIEIGDACRRRLREEMQVEFTIDQGRLYVLDAVRCPRESRASVAIAASLARDGIIPRSEALLRVPPATLSRLLHRQIAPSAEREVLARGVAASPGAAAGRIVFDSAAAQASDARDEACILVRRETTPDDVRGMHAATGVLTERGGSTSHAAVIARGLGLPCVTGATGLTISRRKREMRLPDGRVLSEGDMITIDGSSGEVMAGEVPTLEPALDGAFGDFMAWSDDVRDIGVRANADTVADATLARTFGVDGIGLCRTEHMFFDPARLTVMREMIFAESSTDRAAALERLLPMQRDDFTELFTLMAGLPVCIRLLDPPLHEFLPSEGEGERALAAALDRPLSEVKQRGAALREYNPMLGMRGVRLGVAVPEIYEMQARAIFEATVAASRDGAEVVPEIMIPLVTARREVELVKRRIDAVAAAVQAETGTRFNFRLGVMVETPRAALRAGEIAETSAFLSFGTNDLTQMTYGLSRDDAGRFMSTYVNEGVYPEDPFQTLDIDGVGELLLLGAARGRQARPDVTLALCGEHGGTPEAINFCRLAGFDYVSCSPFRVPVAKLAAAQCTILATRTAK